MRHHDHSVIPETMKRRMGQCRVAAIFGPGKEYESLRAASPHVCQRPWRRRLPAPVDNFSFPQETQNEVRRTWSHGEIARLAKYVVDRTNVLNRNPDAPLPANLKQYGRLFDTAATDADLVDGLRMFSQMQEQRHSANYDHNAQFTKSALVEACENARLARTRLDEAQDQARKAFFALLTVGTNRLPPTLTFSGSSFERSVQGLRSRSSCFVR